MGENEYEVWKNAMDMLKSYLQQTVDVFNQAAGVPDYSRVYLKYFGNLEFEKYPALRRDESAKRTWFRKGATYVCSCGSCTDDPDDDRQLVEVYENVGGTAAEPDSYYCEGA